MAAYTYAGLSDEQKKAVKQTVVDIESSIQGRCSDFEALSLRLGPIGLYQFMSLAMQNLIIHPGIGNDSWFPVNN